MADTAKTGPPGEVDPDKHRPENENPDNENPDNTPDNNTPDKTTSNKGNKDTTSSKYAQENNPAYLPEEAQKYSTSRAEYMNTALENTGQAYNQNRYPDQATPPRPDFLEAYDNEMDNNMDIPSEDDDKLLDSSQELLQELDTMTLNENQALCNESAEIRRSARNTTRINYVDVHKGKDSSQDRKENKGKSDNTKDTEKPGKETDKAKLKKKKKTPKKPSTEAEQIEELKKTIKITEELIEEDDTRIKQLEEALENTRERFSLLTEAHETISEENSRLRQKIEEMNQYEAHLQHMIDQLRQQTENVNERLVNNMKRQITELDNTCLHQQEIIENHNQETEEYLRKIKNLEDLLETMRRRNIIQEKRIAQIKRSASSDEEKICPPKKTRPAPAIDPPVTSNSPQSRTSQTRQRDKEEKDKYRECVMSWAEESQNMPSAIDWTNYTRHTPRYEEMTTANPEPPKPDQNTWKKVEPRKQPSQQQRTETREAPRETPREIPRETPREREEYPPLQVLRHDNTGRHTPPARYHASTSKPAPPRQRTPPRTQTPPRCEYSPLPQRSRKEENRTNQRKPEERPPRDTQTQSSREKPKIGLIMDSNGRHIANELRKPQYTKDNEYIIIPDYRTIEDLKRIPRHQTIIEDLRRLDQIILMIGTNNIKRGDDPHEAANDYNQIIIDIARRANTGISTVEIPPIDPRKDPQGAEKAEAFNKAIYRPTKHIQLRRIKGEQMKTIIEQDGIHLTETGGIRAAKDIHDKTLKADNLEVHKKTIVQIPPEVTSRIIGRRGVNIKKLEDQFQARIVIDQNTAIIRGTRRHAAAEAIREDIETARRKILYD